MISQFLGWIGDFFTRIFNSLFGFLSKLFGYLFQKLFDLLKLIFQPIFILIAILFYFLYKVAELVITLLALLLGIGKLFFALVKGIFLTLAGFSFTSSTPSNGQWTSIFTNVVDGLQSYQFSTVSYILIFLIWFSTGFAAIRIISSMNGGGDN
jgi:hypothetical protein